MFHQGDSIHNTPCFLHALLCSRFFRTVKQWNLKQHCFRDCVLADRSYCYGNFIHHNGITDSLDWLSDWKNLPEILLGYHQYYGDTNEYGYRNLFWRMDKICYSDKPHCTVTSCAGGLYRNQMLCERLVGRTRILLSIGRTAKNSKLSDLCIKI